MKPLEYVLLVLILIFQQNMLFAQGVPYFNAVRALERHSYSEATTLFESSLMGGKLDDSLQFHTYKTLGYVYFRKLNNLSKANYYYELYFSKETKNKIKPIDYFYYGQILRTKQEYTKADSLLYQYSVLSGIKSKQQFFKRSPKDWWSPTEYMIEYAKFNSPYNDFSPVLYKEDLFFSSSRPPKVSLLRHVFQWTEQPFLDIYKVPFVLDKFSKSSITSSRAYSEKEGEMEFQINENLSPNDTKPITGQYHILNGADLAKQVSQLSTRYHDGSMAFSHSGNYTLLSRSSKVSKDIQNGVNQNIGIYLARYSKFGTLSNVQITPFSNHEYSVTDPCFSIKDDFVYFSSDMPGGYGGMDLYRIPFKGGKWGIPENLGREVNTPGNERFPFIDGTNVLYFASDGLPGLGGLDIFKVKTKDHLPAEEPQNLGQPINSPFDDFGYVHKLMGYGFFSSNRKNGKLDDDIYFFRYSEAVPESMTVFVKDSLTDAPVRNAVVLYWETNKYKQAISDYSGKVTLNIYTHYPYPIEVFHPQYYKKSIYYTRVTKETLIIKVKNITQNSQPQYVPELSPLMVSINDRTPETITTKNVPKITEVVKPTNTINFFDSYVYTYLNKTYLHHYSSSEDYMIYTELKVFLDKIVLKMKNQPNYKIQISSHTDSRGNKKDNLKLSERRAKECKNYLIKQGISAKRIKYVGYGEEQLVNDCFDFKKCTDLEHRQNQRTVISFYEPK